jgi:serine/threonine protein phosphatase PrpC
MTMQTALASRRGTRDHNCDAAGTFVGPDGTTLAAVIDGTGNSAALAHLTSVMATVAVRVAYRHGSLPGLLTAGDLLVDDDYDAAAVLAAADPDGEITVAWIGDCRAYRWHHDQLDQYTTDHTMGQQLRASGGVPVEFAATHDHWLRTGLRAATAATVRQVWIPDYDQPLPAGDLILLTSDGVHDQLDRDTIAALVSTHATDLQALADALVTAAPATDGYRDDATVAVIAHRQEPR